MARKRVSVVEVAAVTYRVVEPGVTSISHGEQVYPVKDGLVDLPAGAAWVRELLENGMIVVAEEVDAQPKLLDTPE